MTKSKLYLRNCLLSLLAPATPMAAAQRITAASSSAAVKRVFNDFVNSIRRSSTAAAATPGYCDKARHRRNLAIRPDSEKPSQESVANLLKRLDRDPRKALRFLGRVTGRHGFKPNATTYNLVSSIVGGQRNRVKDFWVGARTTADALVWKESPVRELMAKRVWGEMSIDTYLQLSSRLRGSKMVKRAARLNGFVMDDPGLAKMSMPSTWRLRVSLTSS